MYFQAQESTNGELWFGNWDSSLGVLRSTWAKIPQPELGVALNSQVSRRLSVITFLSKAFGARAEFMIIPCLLITKQKRVGTALPVTCLPRQSLR